MATGFTAINKKPADAATAAKVPDADPPAPDQTLFDPETAGPFADPAVDWPDRMWEGKHVLAWPSRTDSEMPAKPYSFRTIGARPGWYDTIRKGDALEKEFPAYFPGLEPRSTWDNGQLFGEEISLICYDALNAEGHICCEQYLSQEDIVAGLRLVLQDLQDVVWVGHLTALSGDLAYLPLHMKDIDQMTSARFHVWPVHLPGLKHWGLFIYDAGNAEIFYMDSLGKGKESQDFIKNLGPNYKEYLAKHKITNAMGGLITVRTIEVPHQTNGWCCGVHVLENARMYFREPDLKGIPGSTPWTRSATMPARLAGDFDQKDPLLEHAEEEMMFNWGKFFRREVGTARGSFVRLPPRPLGHWDDRSERWDMPNISARYKNLVQKDVGNILDWGHLGWGTVEDPEKGLVKYRLSGICGEPDLRDVHGRGGKKDKKDAAAPIRTPVTPKKKKKPTLKIDTPATRAAKKFDVLAVDDKKKRPAWDVTRDTYDHQLSPERHLSPDHVSGWPGWDAFEQELREERDGPTKSTEEQSNARAERAKKRGARSDS